MNVWSKDIQFSFEYIWKKCAKYLSFFKVSMYDEVRQDVSQFIDMFLIVKCRFLFTSVKCSWRSLTSHMLFVSLSINSGYVSLNFVSNTASSFETFVMITTSIPIIKHINDIMVLGCHIDPTLPRARHRLGAYNFIIGPLCRKSIGDWWIAITKGQKCRVLRPGSSSKETTK